jgi:serine/threonine protein kinase
MAFYPGQIVGNYEIVELIGQGGMATVYKAHHTKLNRNVALKAMYESYVSNPQSIVAFQSEAQTIGRLDHPNIVPVYDYAENDGVYYLVMKFIEGISLTDALDDGLLDIGDIRNIMESIS